MKNFKKAMKNFKKVRLSLGMKIIALLSCVALLSMGFASWWIVKLDTPSASSGSFEAYGVVTQEVTIGAFAFDNDTSTIKFGYPDGYTRTQSDWLIPQTTTATSTAPVQKEVLSTKVGIIISVNDNNADVEDASLSDLLNTATIDFTLGNESAFEKAVKDGYITLNVSYTVSDVTAENGKGSTSKLATEATTSYNFTADTENTGTKISMPISFANANVTKVYVELTITFGWGDHFAKDGANVNPYTFYNSKTSSDPIAEGSATKWADDAVTALGVIATLNSTSAFTITCNAPTLK